jgi:D-alanyl-D-alanine carboxypeptidase (penicillin-binding protein 5/6)
MLSKILASFIILLNPLFGLIPDNQTLAQKTVETKNQLPVTEEEYKLPISDNTFLASQFLPIYPIRNWTADDPKVSAKAALVFETSRRLTLFQKDGLSETRPIASLTKLMTALVAIENAKSDDIFFVSKNAVETPGEMGNLHVGEQITVKNLLYALLVESSNDAAISLAENISIKTNSDFVELMNQRVKSLDLTNTFYADPSGLNPNNRSSAWDLVKIMEEVLKYPLLIEIMQTPSINFSSADGKFNHHLTSTNKLLGKIPEIVGAKTGYTEEAGNCMILAVKAPNKEGLIISVVMDAQDRMTETETLINWTKTAFFW